MEPGFYRAGKSIVSRKQREIAVRPQDDEPTQFLQPFDEGESGDLEAGGEEGGAEPSGEGDNDGMKEMAKKYEDLKSKMEEFFDAENGESSRTPPMVKSPTSPTKAEYERHPTTHTPYAAWCKHCLAARAVRHAHPSKGRKAIVVPDAEGGKGPIKVSMDYMYLHERRGKYRYVAHNKPHMVTIEHRHGRRWAYRVPNKGVMEDAHWLPEKMIQDLDNSGMMHEKIQMKSDQEPSIISVQRAIQEFRPGVIPTNSPVGESECNGRVENIIRRIQEKSTGIEAPVGTRHENHNTRRRPNHV